MTMSKAENTFLIITSIANQENPVLKKYAEEASKYDIRFIVIGDTKSPSEFNLMDCDFFSIERQQNLNFDLVKILPLNHYARKNIGYLLSISRGAEIIIETDDDNFPLENFWEKKTKQVNAHLLNNKGLVNVYKYFTDVLIWPRGFPLENIQDDLPDLENQVIIDCPIQQGLADENPDVDAIYRLTLPLPIIFNNVENVAIGINSFCPFNSQNTTWYKEAFPLLYLPSLCSFRMTDIWRSYVAQRIAWTCGWPIMFHNSTVRQVRNDHNLMNDFRDEVQGYISNSEIIEALQNLNLKNGIENISTNMVLCYLKLVDLGLILQYELDLLRAWLNDIQSFD